jgi:hypothetical protein
MTSALPPPPDPVLRGPAMPPVHPAPPRRLGLGLVAHLVRRELRARPRSSAGAATLGALLGAVLARAPIGGGTTQRAVAAILLLSTAAALADATSPRQREDAALLVRLGCPRLLIRLAAWATVLATFGLPAGAAAWLVVVTGQSAAGQSGAWLTALLLVGAGAATTCGTRLAAPAGTSSTDARTRTLGRLGLGCCLLAIGVALPTFADTGSDLDLALPLGLASGIVGLVVLAPLVAMSAASVLSRLPTASARVAATSLRAQRRGLTIPVALVAAVALVLVVHSVLGSGLGRREHERVHALQRMGPATVGGGDRAVVVAWSLRVLGAGEPKEADLAGLARAAGPGAIAAPISVLRATALPPGGVAGNVTQANGLFSSTDGRPVALATPELLRALGLDPAMAEGGRALVLDDRLLGRTGTVHLVGNDTSGPADRRGTGIRIDAIDAVPGELWAGLPGVLLPRAAVAAIDRAGGIDGQVVSDPGGVDTDAVVRFTGPPTARAVAALEGSGTEAVRGGTAVDLTEQDRTDRAVSVWVRDGADVRELAQGMVVLAVAGLVVALGALRLATRRDDALLAQLGARRRTLLAVSAWRGLAIAGAGAVIGTAVGLGATALGLARYDRRTRFAAEVVLAPIGWHVPALVWWAILAIPALAAMAAMVLAATAGRPEADRAWRST